MAEIKHSTDQANLRRQVVRRGAIREELRLNRAELYVLGQRIQISEQVINRLQANWRGWRKDKRRTRDVE